MDLIVLGGYGEMGRIVTIDLVEHCRGCNITIAGRDVEAARKFAESLKLKGKGVWNISWLKVDVRDHTALAKALKGRDVVLNATNYYNNIHVMKAALEAKVDYVDLGGLYHMTKRQLELDRDFKRAGLTAIIGIGSSPGITNVLAMHSASFLDKVESVEISFGDKTFRKINAPFVVPYALSTLFDEFTLNPYVLVKGRMTKIEPLSIYKKVKFPEPIGDLMCFAVIHSEMATLPSTLKGKGIEECVFLEGFDQEFVDRVKFLIDTGFITDRKVTIDGTSVIPREMTIKLLNNFLPKGAVDDVEYLRVEMIGTKGKKRKKVITYCEVRSNKRWNLPGGSWDTGAPLSIAAQMIASDEVKTKGVVPPELALDAKRFFKELEKRGMKVVTRTEEM